MNKSTDKKKGLRYHIGSFFLKLIGWKTAGQLPPFQKYVLISEPHTSNWDLPLMLLLSMRIGFKLNWVAKDTLFKGLFGRYLKWMGGIPVNRRSRNNFVDQTIEALNKNEKIIIVVSPAGTRGHTHFWRSGFYHIAQGAGVPIVMGFLDYPNKTGGIGPYILTSGNMEKDFERLRDFYATVKGKYPEKFGPVKLRSNTSGESDKKNKPK